MANSVKDTDKGAKKLIAAVKTAKATMTVGVHGEDGGQSDGKLTVLQVATIHEFGLGSSPAMS